MRSSIPSDALSSKARLLLLCDAADIGIVLAAYVGYPRPGGVWSCDLLFGKGLLAQENWTIPLKELHGLSALSNLKVILENSLSNWVDSIHAFSDSEIAICWSVYERTKLTTFVRNRVINIRTKLGLDILHHVDGKENPTDVGTRPELTSAESVQPGSVWLAGKEWMKLSIEKAKDNGVIKTVEDIKLTNDKKKTFKEGIAFDTFDEVEQGFFAVARLEKEDKVRIAKRQAFSHYLFDPLKRSFKSCVRITALVILAKVKWMKRLVTRKIERGEVPESELKKLDYTAPRFSVFSSQPTNEEVKSEQQPMYATEPLTKHFSDIFCDLTRHGLDVTSTVEVCNTDQTKQEERVLRLTEEHLSAALEDLFKRATEEVIKFNDKKKIDKIATVQNGILIYNSRVLEEAELRAVGHLADSINIEQFTSVNFPVPLVDQHSPLALSIALHLPTGVC